MVNIQEEVRILQAILGLRDNPRLSIHHYATEYGIDPKALKKAWLDNQKLRKQKGIK